MYETDELWNLPEDDRRAAFQAQYKAEVERQKMLLGIRSLDELVPVQDENDESDDVAWEDGWKAFLVGNQWYAYMIELCRLFILI